MQYLNSVLFPHPSGLVAVVIVIVIIWTLIIKGIALWRAARHSQKWWFIALLIINTIGILELIYLIWFAKEPISVAPAAVSSTPEA